MRKQAIALMLVLLSILILGAIGCGGGEVDSDGDGWTDTQEQSAGTNPNLADTDGDGYWDSQDPNPLDSNIPIAASPTPTQRSSREADLHAVKTAVDSYVTEAMEWPTASGQLPSPGEYALIDFNASLDRGGTTLTFYPHFISELPKHWDEGVWLIDGAARVSVDMEPEDY
ncbi:hypothetical protein ACFLXV_04200 [Chloroflexota bacterium]